VREARHSTLGGAVITTLKHYETMVGRHIVSESEIARLCQQIYRQHKDALDLIFEHIPDLQTQLKVVLEDEVRSQSELALDHCTKSAVRFLHRSWDKHPLQMRGSSWTPTKRVLLFEITNGPDYIRLRLIIGPVDSNDSEAISFREALFACTQKHRGDFPGGMTTLAPRYTTVLSRELVKKKEYAEPETVAEKARHALRVAIAHDVAVAIKRLRDVFG